MSALYINEWNSIQPHIQLFVKKLFYCAYKSGNNNVDK